jgi:hypothetical protein
MWDKTAFQADILFRLRELEKKKTVPKVSQSMKRWDREMGQLYGHHLSVLTGPTNALRELAFLHSVDQNIGGGHQHTISLGAGRLLHPFRKYRYGPGLYSSPFLRTVEGRCPLAARQTEQGAQKTQTANAGFDIRPWWPLSISQHLLKTQPRFTLPSSERNMRLERPLA